ncbi:hypothetical protein DT076_12690 [Desertihabitans brevis]|uniref:Uncharacterized protein n=1 Tax=Desertihabitans brevis TaxID=2268447 RepID=A0A367YTH1_9ACTN|nr:hypothetical protein [Desertihabitans brevis]RCK69186.1 hypothetical protein DT076_12690 [Desertihabitans brevis]
MSTSSQHGASVAPSGRTLSIAVFAVGAVVAVAAAFGTEWIIRAGLAVAVLAGGLALLLAWRAAARALRQQRERHAETLRAQVSAHRDEVRTERANTMAVLDTLEERFANQRKHTEVLEHRVTTLRSQVADLRHQIARLLPEVSTLRGDKAALTAQVAERDATLVELRAELARREAELVSLSGGEVVHHPRMLDQLPTAEQIWADGDHPTVIDLRAVNGLEFDEQSRKQA